MDQLVEKLAERMAGRVNRRDLISLGLRGLVGLGLGAATLFGSQRHTFAATNCSNYDGNTCNVGSTWCHDHAGNDGCGSRPPCSGCGPGTNCPSGTTDKGYWDCCCDNSEHRCRDCKKSDGTICLCEGDIGPC